jgi:pimeloyl-ACP methyl ester carboxylesterase
MARININGSNFEYVEIGDGTPIVFVHGSISDYRVWKGQMEPFAIKYRVIAYSRRYHYPNEWKGDGSDYSIGLHAQDLVALIKELNIGKVNLIGNSYGAFISLMTAINNPDLVKTLVLNEPPVLPLLVSNPDNPFHILSLFIRDFSTAKNFLNFGLRHMKPAMKALKNNQLEEGVQLFASGVLGKGGYEKLSDTVRASLMDNAQELKVELLGFGFPPFPKDEAAKMTIPTLFVFGKNSPKFLHSISDLLLNILPNSEKVVIPNASHLTHGENPVGYNKKVLEFLSKYN